MIVDKSHKVYVDIGDSSQESCAVVGPRTFPNQLYNKGSANSSPVSSSLEYNVTAL